jgi:hypothetical protein
MSHEKDYIIPGEVFADETVLCMHCGTMIMNLGYKEMPMINRPTKMVQVPFKQKLFNYRTIPVVVYQQGKNRIGHLPYCKDCLKHFNPTQDSDAIIRQLINAYIMEVRWTGLSDDAVEAIRRKFADARIVRKLTVEELVEGRLEE